VWADQIAENGGNHPTSSAANPWRRRRRQPWGLRAGALPPLWLWRCPTGGDDLGAEMSLRTEQGQQKPPPPCPPPATGGEEALRP
jgi:hypothetical protein